MPNNRLVFGTAICLYAGMANGELRVSAGYHLKSQLLRLTSAVVALLLLCPQRIGFSASGESLIRSDYTLDPRVANSTFREWFDDQGMPSTSELMDDPGLAWAVPRGSPTNFVLVADTHNFPYRITCVEDLFSVEVRLGDGQRFRVGTHLFGTETRIIPYGDSDGERDAAGGSHRGDEIVAEYFSPGDVGFAIKHHRPFHRRIDVADDFDVKASQDDIKLQDTHVEIVVGVRRRDRAGVVTVNNPQDYQNGGFGDEQRTGDYPMIFAKPVFPPYVPRDVQQQLIDNLRTMAVLSIRSQHFPRITMVETHLPRATQTKFVNMSR